MVRPKHIPDKASLIRLWCHEGARVFRDRLVNELDRTWFDNATLQQLHSTLDVKSWVIKDFSSTLYGDFMDSTDKEYREMKDKKVVNDLLVEYLDEYNNTFPTKMELVFFQDAVSHVARIARVLCQPRGDSLLLPLPFLLLTFFSFFSSFFLFFNYPPLFYHLTPAFFLYFVCFRYQAHSIHLTEATVFTLFIP